MHRADSMYQVCRSDMRDLVYCKLYLEPYTYRCEKAIRRGHAHILTFNQKHIACKYAVTHEATSIGALALHHTTHTC